MGHCGKNDEMDALNPLKGRSLPFKEWACSHAGALESNIYQSLRQGGLPESVTETWPTAPQSHKIKENADLKSAPGG